MTIHYSCLIKAYSAWRRICSLTTVPSELVINKVDLLWSPDGTQGRATVCMQTLIPPTSLQSYQLVMMDTHGHYQHVPAASHVVRDDSMAICFSDIDVTTLDVNSEVVLVATRRGVNPRAVLASAEARVFLIGEFNADRYMLGTTSFFTIVLLYWRKCTEFLHGNLA